MDPTLVPQIINALLVIGGITVGGVTLEHLLENYVMGWLPQNLKAVFPTLTAYVVTVLTRMATGTPLADALSGITSVLLPLILAGISQAVHGTALGASPVSVSTPPPPSATPPDPPVIGPSGPKVVAGLLLVAFLGLGAGLHSATLNLGSVSLSPTAGACVIVVEPLVAATFYRAGAGAVLTPETDAVGGIQALLTWGPYGIGLAGAVDKDTTDGGTYGAGGIVGVLPYGEAFVLWRDTGALVGVTFPWALGATIQP